MNDYPFRCTICGKTFSISGFSLDDAQRRLSYITTCDVGKHPVMISMREVATQEGITTDSPPLIQAIDT